MKKRPFFCVLLCLLLVCCAAAAQEAPQLLEPAGVQLNTVAAWVGEISDIDVYEGAVVPYTQEFFFEQDGMVDVVHVTPGQMVHTGDPLITLDTAAQEKQLASVRSRIEQLETNAGYEDELAQLDLDILDLELRMLKNASPYDEKAVRLKQIDIQQKQLEIDLAAALREMELEKLESEAAELERDIACNTMTAAFDGRVMFMASLKHGSYIGAYTPLIWLADDTQLFVEASYISERVMAAAHALYARIGGKQYALAYLPQDEQDRLSKVLAGEELTVRFAIENADEEVQAGQYAVVCAESSYAADVLLVPTNVLYTGETGRYLYVIENGVRVRRDVATGLVTDWYTQITDGLQEGELVYVKE